MMLSLNVYGQSCQGIPDGTVERLDKTGMSLEKDRTQDQDGLGTCYANTASLMLQSRLPGNPEVSYLNLAFMYAEKVEAPKVRKNGTDTGLRTKPADKKDDDFLIEGGFSCDAINTAKERGGVCGRADVMLESSIHTANSSVEAKVQKDVLAKLTQYYDGVFKDFGREQEEEVQKKPKRKGWFGFGKKKQEAEEQPEEEKPTKFDDYKVALRNIIQQNKDKFTKEQCMKPDTKNAEAVVENLMARIYQFSENHNNVRNKNYSTIYLAGRQLGSTLRMTINGVLKLEHTINADTKKALMDSYVKEISSANPATVNVQSAFVKALQKVAPKFNEKMFADIGGWSPEDRELFANDTDRYVKKNIESCLDKAKLEYFTKDDGLLKDFTNDTCLVNYTTHAKNIKELVTTLDKANLKNIDSLYTFLMDLPEMNYEEAMMKMVAPDCPDEKKIKIPENLMCENESITYNEGMKTPESDAAFLNKTKEKLQKTMTESMAKGGGVGISICTEFFAQETAGAFYNKTKECPKIKHGFHAVTMIGYRCQAGKVQYLVQNSWGDWKAAETRFGKENFENGKAWIDEEDIARNVYRLDVLK